MRHSATSLRASRTDRTIQWIVRQVGNAGAVAAVFASAGCYATVAQSNATSLVQARAEFLVTDEGRIALRDQLGAGTVKVEGRVVQQDDSAWTVNVYRLTVISGESFAWMGESVQIPMRTVFSVSRRDLDRRATVLAAAGITGAVAAYVWSRGLFGGGFGKTDGPPPPVEVDIRLTPPGR